MDRIESVKIKLHYINLKFPEKWMSLTGSFENSSSYSNKRQKRIGTDLCFRRILAK